MKESWPIFSLHILSSNILFSLSSFTPLLILSPYPPNTYSPPRLPQVIAVASLAQTLRRYTSLNHLAQAARAVLQNSAQISQMLADLNRVDFHNVQEQVSVCVCTCVCMCVKIRYIYI